MADYLRKPPFGTPARDKYDDRLRKARKPCKCGSGMRPTADGKCIACHPETAARFAALVRKKP